MCASARNENGRRYGGESQSPLQRLGGAARKLTQFSSGLSKPFIQRPVMTMLLTASFIVFGILTYKQLAVNDLPAVDYPVISGERVLSRRRPRDDGEHDRDAARETVHADSRAHPITSSSTQGNTNITLQFDLDKSIDRRGDRRAGGDPARERPIARRPAEPADVSKSESERSAGHVHRADQRHADRWRAIQIRAPRRSSSGSTSCPAFRRCRSSA